MVLQLTPYFPIHRGIQHSVALRTHYDWPRRQRGTDLAYWATVQLHVPMALVRHVQYSNSVSCYQESCYSSSGGCTLSRGSGIPLCSSYGMSSTIAAYLPIPLLRNIHI
eukprot:167189-Rhodomonas_salina.3